MGAPRRSPFRPVPFVSAGPGGEICPARPVTARRRHWLMLMGASCGRAAPSRGLPRAPRQRRSLPAALPAPNPAPRRAPRDRGAGGGGRRGSGPAERTWGEAPPGPDGTGPGRPRAVPRPERRGAGPRERSSGGVPAGARRAGRAALRKRQRSPADAGCESGSTCPACGPTEGRGRLHALTPPRPGPAACGEPTAALGRREVEAGGQRPDDVAAAPQRAPRLRRRSRRRYRVASQRGRDGREAAARPPVKAARSPGRSWACGSGLAARSSRRPSPRRPPVGRGLRPGPEMLGGGSPSGTERSASR